MKPSLLEQPFHSLCVEQREGVSRLARVSPEPLLPGAGSLCCYCAELAWGRKGSACWLIPLSQELAELGDWQGHSPHGPEIEGLGRWPHVDHCLGTMLASEGAVPSRSRGALLCCPQQRADSCPCLGDRGDAEASQSLHEGYPPFHKGLLRILRCQALCCSNQLKYCTVDVGTSPGTSQTLVPMLIQALA